MAATHRGARLPENGVHPGQRPDNFEDDDAGSSGGQSETEPDMGDPPQPGICGYAFRLLICVLSGVVFGVAMEKGRVFEPINIRGQMIFKRLLYSKFLVASIAAGMFGLSLMAMIPSSNRKFQRVCIQFYGNIGNRGILACALGGSLMGIGMVLAGACPLMVFVQLGAQHPNAAYTLCGALGGALIFGLLRSMLNSLTRPFFTSSTNPWAKSSYFITALPLVAMFGMLVFAFELLVPWDVEVKKNKPNLGYLEQRSWSPMMTGIIVGLLQLPLVLGAETSLGGSSSISTIVSQVFVGPFKRLSPYLGHYRYGYRNWSQLTFVFGVTGGAYLSAYMSSSLASTKGVGVTEAIIGGFLLMFGAELAGGSTNTHGETGMGLLSILSFITMGCMFSLALITAIILKQTNRITPRVAT